MGIGGISVRVHCPSAAMRCRISVVLTYGEKTERDLWSLYLNTWSAPLSQQETTGVSSANPDGPPVRARNGFDSPRGRSGACVGSRRTRVAAGIGHAVRRAGAAAPDNDHVRPQQYCSRIRRDAHLADLRVAAVSGRTCSDSHGSPTSLASTPERRDCTRGDLRRGKRRLGRATVRRRTCRY